MNMLQIFNVGDEITGYCNGYFGRDDYNDKVCVFVTKDYAVFEDNTGHGSVVNLSEWLFEESRNWLKI